MPSVVSNIRIFRDSKALIALEAAHRNLNHAEVIDAMAALWAVTSKSRREVALHRVKGERRRASVTHRVYESAKAVIDDAVGDESAAEVVAAMVRLWMMAAEPRRSQAIATAAHVRKGAA